MLFVECGLFMAGMQTNVAGIKRIFEVPGSGRLRHRKTYQQIQNGIIHNPSHRCDRAG